MNEYDVLFLIILSSKINIRDIGPQNLFVIRKFTLKV